MSDLTTPLTMLGGLSAQQFLQEYWQKKPLFVKNALPHWPEKIDADELAGLALEAEVESRIISFLPEQKEWRLQHGPFQEDIFNTLPKQHWTLLVQAVDTWLPHLNQLLDEFNFIPNWRLDDLMISYAVDQGSVGPHFDNYDVFLIQGAGQRKWQLGPPVQNDKQSLKHPDICLLKSMEVIEEWLVEPGDLLYLPPKWAHHGVAQGECLTYSVGFRAPSFIHILREYSEWVIDRLDENWLVSDSEFAGQNNPGWANPSKADEVLETLLEKLNAPLQFQDWFAQYQSFSKYDFLNEPEEKHNYHHSQLGQLLNQHDYFYRDEGTRFIYSGVTSDKPRAFFINGSAFEITEAQQPLVIYLCSSRILSTDKLKSLLKTTSQQALLIELLNYGWIYMAEEDEEEHE